MPVPARIAVVQASCPSLHQSFPALLL
jgi:hypothetical protein